VRKHHDLIGRLFHLSDLSCRMAGEATERRVDLEDVEGLVGGDEVPEDQRAEES